MLAWIAHHDAGLVRAGMPGDLDSFGDDRHGLDEALDENGGVGMGGGVPLDVELLRAALLASSR